MKKINMKKEELKDPRRHFKKRNKKRKRKGMKI